MHHANNVVIMQTEQLGWIEALEEELQSSRAKMVEMEQKIMEQDQVITQWWVTTSTTSKTTCG